MDMSKPFRNAAGEHAPQAPILFDKFHIMRHLGDAVDTVRKAEYAPYLWMLARCEDQAHQVRCPNYVSLRPPRSRPRCLSRSNGSVPLEIVFQQRDVPQIRAEHHVEHVPKKRDRAKAGFDRNVEHHSGN